MGTYLVLASLLLQPHPRFASLFHGFLNPWSLLHKLVCAALSFALAISVWWSRVRLGHHTTAQVIAGGVLGGALALTAFIQWQGTAFICDHTSLFCSVQHPALSQDGWRVLGERLEHIVLDALADVWLAVKAQNASDVWDTCVAAFWATREVVVEAVA